MKRDQWIGVGGQLLRVLAIAVILALLVPRIFAAFVDLYNTILLQRGDRVPSGNSLKVEAPGKSHQNNMQ